MKKIILLLIIFNKFFSIENAYTQDSIKFDDYVNYGIFTNYNYMIHKSDFKRLPGIPNCCPEFTEGYSKGFTIGGVYEYLFPKYGFEFRAGLNFIKGNFTSSEDQVFSLDGEPINGKIDHIIDFNLNSINIESSFKYEINKKISLSLGLGLSAYYNSSYNQFEKISSPEGTIYFLDSNGKNTLKSTRNERTGDIPDLNILQPYITAKIGYSLDIKKDKSLMLRPEIGFDYYFSNMIENFDWHTLTLRFGISLYFTTQKFTESETSDIAEKPIELQVVDLKIEIADLKKQNENIVNVNKNLEDNLKKEQVEKDTIVKVLNEKENSLKLKEDSTLAERRKIEEERSDFNKMIDAENKRTGKVCNCYVILYTTTTDKNEAEKLFNYLKTNGINNVSIITFIEPYLKDKYYRVQSNCYTAPLEAFDDKLKHQPITNLLNIIPQILCNR